MTQLAIIIREVEREAEIAYRNLNEIQESFMEEGKKGAGKLLSEIQWKINDAFTLKAEHDLWVEVMELYQAAPEGADVVEEIRKHHRRLLTGVLKRTSLRTSTDGHGIAEVAEQAGRQKVALFLGEILEHAQKNGDKS